MIIANAGPDVADAPHIVDMLAAQFAAGKIAAVIGLDQSRDETGAAIEKLTSLGVPIIGPSMSADKLASLSPMYFQISLPDSAIATMIAGCLNSVPWQSELMP